MTRDSQIVILTNFVVVSSVGIKRVVYTIITTTTTTTKSTTTKVAIAHIISLTLKLYKLYLVDYFLKSPLILVGFIQCGFPNICYVS